MDVALPVAGDCAGVVLARHVPSIGAVGNRIDGQPDGLCSTSKAEKEEHCAEGSLLHERQSAELCHILTPSQYPSALLLLAHGWAAGPRTALLPGFWCLVSEF
jgi:hypothetical protein